MNERIKDLAEQVGFGPAWFEESPPGYPALPKEGMLKEFAELIVQECTDLVQKYMTRWPEDCELTKQIKEHFGVEE